MKQYITYLIMSMSLTAYAQNDSVPSLLEQSSFPYVNPVSTNDGLTLRITSLQYSKAASEAQRLLTTAKRKRESTEEYDHIISLCKKGESGLRGVDRITIVDSLVTDKKDFLKAYPLTAELGTLTLSERGDIVQYQTQINGMVLRPEDTDSTHLKIVRYYLDTTNAPINHSSNNSISKSTSQFSHKDTTFLPLTEGEPIQGLNIEGDTNYPFLMPDGQTLYFATRSSEGYGNYDLYVTRYDSDAKRFYQADNMGFPYNSYANDYMLVIDEAANLGWFASDRYQPEGKVCIYTFIPNESRQTIDYETTPLEDICAAASLRSISTIPLTDEQKKAKATALQRIKQLHTTSAATQAKDFEFVLNDSKTCYTNSDFTSSKAKQLCSDWLQKTKNLTVLSQQLQQMRESSPSNRQQILNLETRIIQLQSETNNLAKLIRTTELSK